ncbi:MAG: GspE/PulE family protein [Desulfobacteraceae bacterium]|jgi:type II secretory ATPase GspE/PulE/Tfp pilus assembly ATPase PilB-like protein
MLKAYQPNAEPDNGNGVVNLKTEVEYRAMLQEIGNKINAARDLDEILIDLKDDILSLFCAERLTVYVVDGVKRELVSRFKSGDEIAEIRLPVSKSSLAGYSALTHNLLNISNVYDQKELSGIDDELQFDKSWDQKTGYRTKQVLVYPIIFQKYLMGALQLINLKDGGSFTQEDEKTVADLSKIIGIALYNQKRIAARSSRISKFDYLLENHLLTQKELTKAVSDSQQRKDTIETTLLKEYKIPKTELGESLSRYYKIPFISFNATQPIPGELLSGLKVPFMRNNVWVPIRSEDKHPVVAIDDPHDLKRIDEIKSLFPGRQLKFVVAIKQDILDFIKLFTQDEKEMAEIDDILSQLQDETDEIDEAESSVGEEDSAVVQLVNKIILDAYARGASDIHIEPYAGKKNTMVRIRVDGSCTVYQTIPFAYRNAVVSRIKIMSDLDIAERRLPQDGKIKFKKYGGKDIELRVATIPTQGGLEDVVMRILAAGEPLPLGKMGFSESNYENFIKAVVNPYGLILVCGPTGSGKTTTLHSALAYINKTETKIWTAEDPVEITQKGLRQVQVKSKIGFSFAAAMRSFLRADPDVIMVGEMRDKETTHIGIEASLTGHLVFSTLHTNSAPESITRLLDMGMDPFNFADAILCILAQRLVRTLCPDCKKAYTPTKEEYSELVREYGEEDYEKNENPKYSEELTLYRPTGCDLCHGTGYRGRMGLHELLIGTDPMKKQIQLRAEMGVIRDQAIADGMTTLKQDGIEKIIAGHTDLLQVRKVCIK